MIITDTFDNGSVVFVAAARSDDGAVELTQALAGTCALVDTATGRNMWRGLYQDADGYYRDERVPEALWSIAIDLMREVDTHNDAQRDTQREAANAKLEAWADAIPGIMLTMDDKDSDL